MILVWLTFRPTFAKERVIGNKTVLGHALFDCNDLINYQTQLVFDREQVLIVLNPNKHQNDFCRELSKTCS